MSIAVGSARGRRARCAFARRHRARARPA